MKTFNNLEECIKEIKRLRIQVDALIQIANENKTSAETTLAWRELQLAKAWLGKLLGDVSKTPSPYIQVSKPELIPATTEVAELAPYKFGSTLDMCNSQRNIIETTIQDIYDSWGSVEIAMGEYNYELEKKYGETFEDGNKGMSKENYEKYCKEKIVLGKDYVEIVTTHLHQARFWYGFELSNLRTV